VHEPVPTLWRRLESDAAVLCAAACVNRTSLTNATCAAGCDELGHLLSRYAFSSAELPSSYTDVQLTFRTRVRAQ
jgi:hypothetical protein